MPEKETEKNKNKKKKLKAYQFSVSHFTHGEMVFVLAHSEEEARQILSEKGYRDISVTCKKVKKKPGIIYSYDYD